jgi:hypothetical protein
VVVGIHERLIETNSGVISVDEIVNAPLFYHFCDNPLNNDCLIKIFVMNHNDHQYIYLSHVNISFDISGRNADPYGFSDLIILEIQRNSSGAWEITDYRI